MKGKIRGLLKNKKVFFIITGVLILALGTSVYAYQTYQTYQQKLAEEKALEERLALEVRNFELLEEVETSVVALFVEDGQDLAESVNQEMIDAEYAKLDEFDKNELNDEGIILFNELKLAVADANNMLLLNDLINGYTVEVVLNDDALTEKIEFAMSVISDNRAGYVETVQSKIADIDVEVAAVKDIQNQVAGLLNDDETAKEDVTRESYDAVKALVEKVSVESVREDLNSKLGVVLTAIEAKEEEVRLAEEAAKNSVASGGSSSSNSGGSSGGNTSNSGGNSSSGNSGGNTSNSGGNSSSGNSGGNSSSNVASNNNNNSSGSSSSNNTSSNTSSGSSGSSNSSGGSSSSGDSSGGSSSGGSNTTEVTPDYYGNDGDGSDYYGGSW